MRIEILYFAGCPNYLPALERVRTVLRQEGLAIEVTEIEVKGEADAKALRFFGSPAIRVNGLDIDAVPPGAEGAGLACRRYLPSEDIIRMALQEARE
jgi:hypothetical protein